MAPRAAPGSNGAPMPPDDEEGWQPGQSPSVRDALVLLGSAALCCALFYLWLGEIGPALGYGALTGFGLAAIGAEFYKFVRSYRLENPTRSTSAALQSLVAQSFRIGFFSTFRMIMGEIIKLLGIKLLVSLVIALTAAFLAGRHYLS
jgi:hypothetical protein